MAMSGYQGNYIGLEETSTVSSQAPMVGRYYSDISQHTIQAVPAGRYYKVVDYYHEDLSSTGSDSSINRSTELFPSALKQLRKPSQASFTDDFIKKYYWNERFQLLLEKPVTNKEEGNRRHIEIAEHSQSLADNAMPIVKTIVDEVDLPFEGKTYKPIDAGGLAGGQKYIVDKMFVKFASDVYSLYGGDDNSAKAAGHELKGLSALISCNIPNLHFPLLCVINYKGYRVTVISRIPVDKNTIIYGSDDAGNTIHNRSYEIDKMLRHAAEILNLKVHKVKEHATGEVKEVPVPIDLEGHQGTDGRYYVVDFARLLPPETPFPTGTAAYLFRMLRPEFVRQYPRALSSDAFSPFGIEDVTDNNQQAKEATKFLHLKAIPQLAESLPSLLENPKNGCTKHLDDDDMAPLKRILHKYGINLRYLALLLHHVIKNHTAQHRTSQVLALEIVARSMKSILNGKMRLENSANAISICVQCFNMILGSGPNDFWDSSLRPQLTRQFVCHLNECSAGAIDTIKRLVEEDYLVLIVKEFRLPLLRRVSVLTGIILNAANMTELHAKPLEFWDADEPLNTSCIEEISMTMKHISVVPIAEVLRMEGRFLEAERFYQDEMNLRIKVLGADSLQVAVTMTHLAALYAEMASKDHLADNYFNQAILIYEARRPDSLELALAYERLAMFSFRRDKYQEAEEMLEKVYGIKHKLLGVHNEVATTIEHQAWIAHAQQKYDLAVKLFTDAVEMKKVTLSEDSLEVAKTLNNLGQTLVVLKKPEQALKLYEKVLEILKNQRGNMHSDVAVALDNLAKLYALDTKTLGKAELYFKEALAIKTEALGDDHAFTAITQDHLAQLLSRCSRYEEAEELYKKAIATLRKKLGTRHSSVGITLHNIAQLYARRRNWNRAMEAEEEAARIFAYAVGESNELTLAAETALKEIQKRSGIISRLLSKGMDLPTMLHVGRIITDNPDSTPIPPPRKSKALDDMNKLPEDYRRLLRSAGIKQGESDPALLAAVLAIVKEVTTPSSSTSPAPLSVPSSPPPQERKHLPRAPRSSDLSLSADVPGPHGNLRKERLKPKKERIGDPRSLFAGLRIGRGSAEHVISGKASAENVLSGRAEHVSSRRASAEHVVSDPYDFQHISHVGFSKDGFEMYNVPTSWKSVFSLNLGLPSISAPSSPSPRDAIPASSASAPTSPSANSSPSSPPAPFTRAVSVDSARKSFLFGVKRKKETRKENKSRSSPQQEEQKEVRSDGARMDKMVVDDQLKEKVECEIQKTSKSFKKKDAAPVLRSRLHQSLPEFRTPVTPPLNTVTNGTQLRLTQEHAPATRASTIVDHHPPHSPQQQLEQEKQTQDKKQRPLSIPPAKSSAPSRPGSGPNSVGGGGMARGGSMGSGPSVPAPPSSSAKYSSFASKSFTSSPNSSLGASLDMRIPAQRTISPPLSSRPLAPAAPSRPSPSPASGPPPAPPPAHQVSPPPPPPPAGASPSSATAPRNKSISSESSAQFLNSTIARARKPGVPASMQIEGSPDLFSAVHSAPSPAPPSPRTLASSASIPARASTFSSPSAHPSSSASPSDRSSSSRDHFGGKIDLSVAPDFETVGHHRRAIHHPRSASAHLPHIPAPTPQSLSSSVKSPPPPRQEPSFLTTLSMSLADDESTAAFISSLPTILPSTTPTPTIIPTIAPTTISRPLPPFPPVPSPTSTPTIIPTPVPTLTPSLASTTTSTFEDSGPSSSQDLHESADLVLPREKKKEEKKEEDHYEDEVTLEQDEQETSRSSADNDEEEGRMEASESENDDEREESSEDYYEHTEWEGDTSPDLDEPLPDLSNLTPTQWRNLVALVRDTSYRHRIIAAFADG